MKIIVEFGNIEKYDDTGKMIFDKAWSIEGNVLLTPRIIWFMNALQELSKEYKRRDMDSVVAKNKVKKDE
jgi:hypothetical protein